MASKWYCSLLASDRIYVTLVIGPKLASSQIQWQWKRYSVFMSSGEPGLKGSVDNEQWSKHITPSLRNWNWHFTNVVCSDNTWKIAISLIAPLSLSGAISHRHYYTCCCSAWSTLNLQTTIQYYVVVHIFMTSCILKSSWHFFKI